VCAARTPKVYNLAANGGNMPKRERVDMNGEFASFQGALDQLEWTILSVEYPKGREEEREELAQLVGQVKDLFEQILPIEFPAKEMSAKKKRIPKIPVVK
jgi:hypothetical protein